MTWILWLVVAGAAALGYDLARVFIERAGLGDGFDGLLHLRVGGEEDFVAFLGAVGGHENFLLDLALDPVEVVGELDFGVLHVVLRKIVAEFAENVVVHFEAVRDDRLGAEIIARETGNTLLGRVEHIGAEKRFLDLMVLGRGHNDIRRDAAATGYLTAAVGLADFRRVIGNFALVVILVKRDGLVVALNKVAAGRVITRGGESQAGIFGERLPGLHEAFAEGGFADDEAAVVVLNGARNDFRGGGGVVVDQDDDGHVQALIAAHGEEAALWRAAAVIRNDKLTFFKEHVADGNGFIEQTAGIAAEIENRSEEHTS